MSFFDAKCAECGVKSNNPQVPHKECGGCRQVAYCSRNCQKKHWLKSHKGTCPNKPESAQEQKQAGAKPVLGATVTCNVCGETYNKGVNLGVYGCSCWKKKAQEEKDKEKKKGGGGGAGGEEKRAEKQKHNKGEKKVEQEAKEDSAPAHDEPKGKKGKDKKGKEQNNQQQQHQGQQQKHEKPAEVKRPEPVKAPVVIKPAFKIDSDADLRALNAHLAASMYIQNLQATQEDVAVFNQWRFPDTPIDADKYPHVARWYRHIASFSRLDTSRWPVSCKLKMQSEPAVARASASSSSDDAEVKHAAPAQEKQGKKDKKDKKQKKQQQAEEKGSRKNSEAADSKPARKESAAAEKPASRKASDADTPAKPASRKASAADKPASRKQSEADKKPASRKQSEADKPASRKQSEADKPASRKQSEADKNQKGGSRKSSDADSSSKKKGGSRKASAADESKHAKKVETVAEEEEDDMGENMSLDDLAGDDDDEATRDMLAKKQDQIREIVERQTKAASKAKSNLTLDVAPFDIETDMGELEKKIRTIELDGMKWLGASLVPIAYGIKKLRIMCQISDASGLSPDTIREEIEKFEDEVQSTDVFAFQMA